MPADSPQAGGRRTAEGAAAVAMLREKLDALDADLVAASAAVAVDPTDPAALQRRADLYLARGRKQEALADLRSAVALDQSAAPTDGVVGEWRRASWWLAWRVYTALVVVLGDGARFGATCRADGAARPRTQPVVLGLGARRPGKGHQHASQRCAARQRCSARAAAGQPAALADATLCGGCAGPPGCGGSAAG